MLNGLGIAAEQSPRKTLSQRLIDMVGNPRHVIVGTAAIVGILLIVTATIRMIDGGSEHRIPQGMDDCTFLAPPNPSIGEARAAYDEYLGLLRKAAEDAGVHPDGIDAVFSGTADDFEEENLASIVEGIPSGGVMKQRGIHCRSLKEAAATLRTRPAQPGDPDIETQLEYTRKYPYWALFQQGLPICRLYATGDAQPYDEVGKRIMEETSAVLCPRLR
ncbi:hypothetical protein [Mycobacterium sp. GA-1285]|uniref:hypothetical protein n=1 Tax=Mycobacterium sp. GA-1285 TaxID=1772282 RepID=UPI0012E3F552|nr:hypothetical protein [Mycobacterium sp. GA-1285]